MAYSNSPLVNYKLISPNKSVRTHKIDTITIHHVAGNPSIEGLGQIFYPTSRKASSNYGVGSDGRVGLFADEKYRSWCSSSKSNDQRAVTIEVCNCTREPDWRVTDAALNSLIKLVADICKRNGIAKLVWSDNKADRVGHKNGCNMTVHRDFVATSCPGPYLLGKMKYIADEVNKLLGVSDDKKTGFPYLVKINCSVLNVRSGPGTSYSINTSVRRGEVYTIVDESSDHKWGKLKSGAGWICLAYTLRL